MATLLLACLLACLLAWGLVATLSLSLSLPHSTQTCTEIRLNHTAHAAPGRRSLLGRLARNGTEEECGSVPTLKTPAVPALRYKDLRASSSFRTGLSMQCIEMLPSSQRKSDPPTPQKKNTETEPLLFRNPILHIPSPSPSRLEAGGGPSEQTRLGARRKRRRTECGAFWGPLGLFFGVFGGWGM